jgi:leader peptidase (prepilin peptidase)/N-methyltransferase
LGAALATVGAVVGALLGALTGDLRGAAAGAILAPAVLAIADLDRRRGLIADAHSALVAAAGLLGAGALAPDLTVIDQALGLGLGLGVFAAVKVGVRMARGVDGLGGGDVLLAGAGGLWTGWLWFGPWVAIAAGATLAFAALTGRLAPGARIAFGPGLALGLPITVAVAAFAPI